MPGAATSNSANRQRFGCHQHPAARSTPAATTAVGEPMSLPVAAISKLPAFVRRRNQVILDRTVQGARRRVDRDHDREQQEEHSTDHRDDRERSQRERVEVG